jgi:hypothetical protein
MLLSSLTLLRAISKATAVIAKSILDRILRTDFLTTPPAKVFIARATLPFRDPVVVLGAIPRVLNPERRSVATGKFKVFH